MRLTIEESRAIPTSERPPRPGYQNRRLTKTLLTGYCTVFMISPYCSRNLF